MSAENALTEKAQAYLVECLCCTFCIFDTRVVVYTEEKAELLRFLLDHKYVPRSMVERAVKDRLISLGQAMYEDYLRSGTYPDHLGSQPVFGYFLSYQDVGLQVAIKFDHGETAEEYIKSSDGLLWSVVEQLLVFKNPEPVSLGKSGDDHCCCSH